MFFASLLYRDRLVPVHEGFGLPAYMIRLMTSTMMPLTRDGVCETLYVLCDKDGKIMSITSFFYSYINYYFSKQVYTPGWIW